MWIYWQLFYTYFKIGLFGFGGGYTILSYIQHVTVEEYKWLTINEFTDIVAVSQMTPGPIAINLATYTGYMITGTTWGSIVATLAVCFPSFAIIFLISRNYQHFRSNCYVNYAFKGLRPAVIGLIATAALFLINKENFVDYRSCIIFIVTFCFAFFKKFHPILLTLFAGIAGLLLY
ncbi:MAG: chromate transporter [Candidatus Azobacteroides pseudotrichonymphae]|jgi:chromate transporter|nr:chromate transporter [Bacteroidales bacterium OttesenSCG-928-I14]GMO34785.1 MAG: chromate transporter [Candidatus Azobacteroides pseudotrichonymphae]